MNIVIFATAVYTDTLTGGDRIFVECAKRWVTLGHHITVVTNEAGEQYCVANGLGASHIILWPTSKSDAMGVYIAMIVKALVSFVRAFWFARERADIVFASSFFFPDMIPAFFMKLTNPKSKLAVACYLFTTQTWGVDYSGGKLKGFLFYLNERIAFAIMHAFGNALFTASRYDKNLFAQTEHFPASRVMAVRGGVDSTLFSGKSEVKKYDAIFVGRLHPQKCIDALITIWKEVAKKDAKRKLAIVGSGLMKDELVQLVDQLGLKNNVLFLGALDGKEKIIILSESRLFVSASLYDSGNIALDEGLAAGLPGVIYDLPRLDYPKGVIKIPIGNQTAFADAINMLLVSEDKRMKLSQEAKRFAKTIDWNIKSEEILTFLQKS